MLEFYKTTKKPDIKKLLFNESVAPYNAFSGTLVLTNELPQIKELKKYISSDTKILTVSGSGEQPLFFKMYGAKNVITFDISFTSYLVTSLKMSAIQIFTTNTEYNMFLDDLYTIKTLDDLSQKKYLSKAVQNLNEENKFYMEKTILYQDRRGLLYRNSSCNFYSLNQKEFDLLRKSLKTNIPFIWTDIKRLYKGIYKEKFDIIYYSNILSFKESSSFNKILENAKQHLTSTGKFVITLEPHNLDKIQNAVKDVFLRGFDVKILPQKEYFQQMIVQPVR